jgi:multiple sugar transport system ATP-binding protein
MISGLEAVSGGQILLNGRDVTFAHPSARDIAYVFQFYALYTHMTAWENIAFPLQAQQLNSEDVRKRVAEVAEMLKISHLLKLRPGSLSGGDQQRVALARALVRRPAAFLMDEPLGALDADFREQMRAEIKRLHIRLHATSVYVTHDQVEAMAMADRIVVMSNAAVQQIGTPSDVYYEPANLFVANFIGSPGMNLVKGKFVGGVVQLPGDHRLSVTDSWKSALTQQLGNDGAVVVGFRPEAGELVADGDVTGEVYAVDMNGSDSLLYLTLVDKTIIRIRVDRSVKAPIGTVANIRIDPKYIRFFNAETEAALKREA